MITLFAKLFIKKEDRKNYSSPQVRTSYGVIAGLVGIILNAGLFVMKLIIGLLSGALSIISDAFNNLSDAFSDIISIMGFRVATRKADEEHPFGHGRAEYVSGLIVGLIVMVIGFEFLNTSISRIRHPKVPAIDLVTIAILIVSIAVKLYMYFANRSLAKKIGSVSLNAVALDSVSDVVTTFVVLLSAVFYYSWNINIDGWTGLLVSAFIIGQGLKSVRDAVSPLLGNPPDPEQIAKIRATVAEYKNRGVLGVHDIVVHSYGPGKDMVTCHVEMPGDMTLSEVHTVVDTIERRLLGEYGLDAVIHMDPVEEDDPYTADMKARIKKFAEGLKKDITVHDIQIAACKNGRHDIDFDVDVPYSDKDSDEDIIRMFKAFVSGVDANCHCRIRVDRG